jgi:hypothetical protein
LNSRFGGQALAIGEVVLSPYPEGGSQKKKKKKTEKIQIFLEKFGG